MDREELLNMDSYMLLSFINMKLRDEYSSLTLLCDEYEITREELFSKLNSIGYNYNENVNQFKGV